MTNLSAVARVRLVEDLQSDTVPGGEAIGPGVPVRLDASTAKAMIANASDQTEAKVIGLNLSPKLTVANMAAHILRRGKVALYDASEANILAGLDYGAAVWLSATDGLLADADPGTNEKQTLTITGTPTGGDFTLTVGGQTTAAIAYNAAASAVQAALEALSTIGLGNVRCSGGALPGTPVVIEFVQDLGTTDVALITGTFTGLTGGSSPDGAIAETVSGVESVLIGRVIPLWDGSTPTKLLDFDLR